MIQMTMEEATTRIQQLKEEFKDCSLGEAVNITKSICYLNGYIQGYSDAKSENKG